IGRLDYNSSGILLLTNDGDFANLLMHPRYEIKKEYVVKVKGIPSKQDLEQLKKGIKHNGDLLKAIDCQVKSTDRKKQTAIIDITLQEGKNRHIRRMMEHLGYSVSKLSREKYGFLTLNGLQPGKYRELSKQEVHQIGIKHNGDLLKAIDCQVKSTDRKKQTAIIDITLQEGKNRHIRRMMEHLGYSVSKLSREKYGFLTLNGLQPGKYRELSKQEVH